LKHIEELYLSSYANDDRELYRFIDFIQMNKVVFVYLNEERLFRFFKSYALPCKAIAKAYDLRTEAVDYY
jgi:hypothetical protein